MPGLSRHYCNNCEQGTLHKGLKCVHCGTTAKDIDMSPLETNIKYGVSKCFYGTRDERRRATAQQIIPDRVKR